jgi:hypothetical protein
MARRSLERVLTDREEIRQWAEERGARPARVKGTGGDGDVGIIRLDFPGYTGEDSLEPISWDDWFRKFDESNLALIVQDVTASGERSNFNKLVSRETLEALAQHGERQRSTAQSRSSQEASNNRKSSSRRATARSSRSATSRGSRSRSSGKGGTAAKSRTRSSASSRRKTAARASSRRQSSQSQGSRKKAA